MSDAPRLFGTRAIVTAAADGIGEAVVRIMAKQGAEIIAVDKPDSGIETRFRGLKSVTSLSGSLLDADGVDAIVEETKHTLGGIDVVVNIGYLQPKTPLSDADTAELDALLERKIRSYSMLARSAMTYLKNSPAGRIIGIGCLRSAFTIDGARAFRRSEQALAELTASLAKDAGPIGTNATYLQPGAIMTPDSRRVLRANKELRDYCIRNSAAGRVGEPVDVAKAVLFLASDDSVFVTGTGILVDGGARSATV
jgi:NAD(P)-dependent dehydrogenase (short-subunit alcohol dehydrogenase family)